MSLTTLVDKYLQSNTPTETDKQVAIETIAEQSITEFAKQNILPEDAQVVALTDEDFIEHCKHLLTVDPESIDEHVNPVKYAYHLAFTNPELGTQLLDELLYYRNLGRI